VLGAVVLLGGFAALGARHDLSDRWDAFKNPAPGASYSTSARFQSSSGNGRYQYWSGAVKAARSAPVKGIGAGSFELWWKQHATIPGKIRHAHSQVFETYAELGTPGLLLFVGFIVFVLASGLIRSLKGPRRGLAAAATAGAAAFAVSALVDWSWDVTVVPAAFLGLAAVVLAPAGPKAQALRRKGLIASRPLRIGAAVVAAAAIALISIPLASSSYIRDSRASFNTGAFAAALQDARRAEQIQPYAAGPRLQQALVFERAGRLPQAAQAARAAAAEEPKNAVVWVVLSRIEAARGRAKPAVSAYRKARKLDRNFVATLQ
jgi:hypothetical protein